MKVLHVIWHLGQGGAQTYLFNLLKEQIMDNDLEPVILVLGARGTLSDQFENIFEVIYLEMRSGIDLVRAFRIVPAIKNSNVQMIHSHSNNIAFNVVLQFLGFPVVFTEHGGGLLGGRKRNHFIYRFSLHF